MQELKKRKEKVFVFVVVVVVVEGMLIRSRARWIGEREKVSKYFSNLEKSHYTSKIIRKIEKQDATIVTEQDDVVKETKYFYELLHCSSVNFGMLSCSWIISSKLTSLICSSCLYKEKINYVNFEEIIQEQESIPKLKEEQCNSLEGKISKDEVLSTLKRMKNGTSPGSDGFTVNFLKFFWNDISSLLARAINESFRKESLSSPQKQCNYSATKGGQTATVSQNLETNHAIKCVV